MHQEFMQAAISLAENKIPLGEGGPFAAVIVREGRIIGQGWNQVVATNDPTAHAEVVAIRDACSALTSFSLAGCTLYVNCEPCPMCLAAAYWAGIETIYYAATREDAAAIGFADARLYEEFARPRLDRSLPMHQLMRQEALASFGIWEAMPGKIPY
ncbi:MAG: nucleoside deaminase [Thermodesulfobacteriota bacterium]